LFSIKIERDKPRPNFASALAGRQLDHFTPVSNAAPSRARKTRRTENRRLSRLAIPPPALTARCAGTSDDRPDLPADDWTAPPTHEPVAAAAIESAVGSFSGASAVMRRDSIVRQKERKN
jgi:hypothetical protein